MKNPHNPSKAPSQSQSYGIIIAAGFLLSSIISFSQNIGINTTGNAADPSAMLDVVATDKGILIPRVSLTSTTDVATITGTEAVSLLVYNTNAGMTGGSIGFWYWDGSKWVKIITSGNATSVNAHCYTCDGF